MDRHQERLLYVAEIVLNDRRVVSIIRQLIFNVLTYLAETFRYGQAIVSDYPWSRLTGVICAYCIIICPDNAKYFVRMMISLDVNSVFVGIVKYAFYRIRIFNTFRGARGWTHRRFLKVRPLPSSLPTKCLGKKMNWSTNSIVISTFPVRFTHVNRLI